ncbi:MAG: GNAT family N-acetyltransferase [Bdellovibrionota bacterium]
MNKKSKYFKHYKNKSYRYLGVAKHSEELNDYVIYECLYPNDLATLWIRPKDMFFEVGEFQGKTTPRFSQVAFEIKKFTELNSELTGALVKLCHDTLIDFNEENFLTKLKNQKNMTLFCFFYEQELVGFKAGFEIDETKYYSWLGAVSKAHRKLGVANALTQEQHAWAKTQNYKLMQTKSDNRHKEMMHLNLNAGFDIVGTEQTSISPVLKILFEKKL